MQAKPLTAWRSKSVVGEYLNVVMASLERFPYLKEIARKHMLVNVGLIVERLLPWAYVEAVRSRRHHHFTLGPRPAVPHWRLERRSWGKTLF